MQAMNALLHKLSELARKVCAISLALALSLLLSACSGGDGGSSGGGTASQGGGAAQGGSAPQSGGSESQEGASSGTDGQTSGPAFDPGTVDAAKFDSKSALSLSGTMIDISNIKKGYVGASAKSSSRLKFEVAKGGVSMYYDMPTDGTPILAPLSMGDGPYDFAVWENTSGQKYAKLSSTSKDVSMTDEYQPFLHNNVYCDYGRGSEAAKLAEKLTSGAANEGDALAAIYDWVVANITYDKDKAEELSGKSGYVPDPDSTISSKKGICFDYSSLVAAMLRSIGIPCKIVTGDVAPNNIYHAWNMVFIDGTWVNTYIDVQAKEWTRVDTTFAASGADNSFVGDGTNYSERYTY